MVFFYLLCNAQALSWRFVFLTDGSAEVGITSPLPHSHDVKQKEIAALGRHVVCFGIDNFVQFLSVLEATMSVLYHLHPV